MSNNVKTAQWGVATTKTASVPIYVANMGPGWLRVCQLKIHQGKACAKYEVEMGNSGRTWYAKRIGPDTLAVSVRVQKEPSDALWYEFTMQVSSGAVVQNRPEFQTGTEFEFDMHTRAEKLLKWLLPLQERMDILFENMGLTAKDLVNFDMAPFIEELDMGDDIHHGHTDS